MSQGSLNPKIRFLGQKMWPVARSQTHRHTDRRTQSDYWGHSFRVSGFFPSTYHQGSAQQTQAQSGYVKDIYLWTETHESIVSDVRWWHSPHFFWQLNVVTSSIKLSIGCISIYKPLVYITLYIPHTDQPVNSQTNKGSCRWLQCHLTRTHSSPHTGSTRLADSWMLFTAGLIPSVEDGEIEAVNKLSVKSIRHLDWGELWGRRAGVVSLECCHVWNYVSLGGWIYYWTDVLHSFGPQYVGHRAWRQNIWMSDVWI